MGFKQDVQIAVTSCLFTVVGMSFCVWSYGIPYFEKSIRAEYKYVNNIDKEVVIGAKLLQSSCDAEKVCDPEVARKYVTRIANIKKIYSQTEKK